MDKIPREMTVQTNGPPLARLLQLIHRRRELTRAEVTRALGVSRTSAGLLLDELEALGLVRVGSPSRVAGTPGRPSPQVAIDRDGPNVLAAQIHQTHVELARVGLGARIVTFESPDVDPADQDAVIGVLASWVRRAIRTGPRVIGATIAVPGLVRDDGFIYSAPYLGWQSIAMRSVLLARTRRKIPIEVGNDANLAALGEYRHGAGAGSATLLVLLAEEIGVGGGLVHGGELFTGSAGYGLEAGHLQVDPRGRRCPCGARGCLQVQCDSEALLRAARRRPTGANPAADAAAVLAAAAAGDPRCRAAVDDVAGWLGTGLTGLVNLVNPDRIALLGVHRELVRQRHDELLSRIRSEALVAHTAEISLVAGSLEEPVLIGAAERALEPLLRNPRLAMSPQALPV